MLIKTLITLIMEKKMTSATIVAILISILVALYGPEILPSDCPEPTPIERNDDGLSKETLEKTLPENVPEISEPDSPEKR